VIYYFLESFLTEIKDAIRDKGNMSPTEEIPTEEIPNYIENLSSTGGLIVSLSETSELTAVSLSETSELTVSLSETSELTVSLSETIADNITIIEPL